MQAGCEARVRAALTLRVDLLDGVEEDVRVDDALIALLGDEDAWIVVSHPQHSVFRLHASVVAIAESLALDRRELVPLVEELDDVEVRGGGEGLAMVHLVEKAARLAPLLLGDLKRGAMFGHGIVVGHVWKFVTSFSRSFGTPQIDSA